MKNNSKGFTLVEMIVSMAVTIIVLGMVATLSFSTNKIVTKQKLSTRCIENCQLAKSSIESFFNNYSVSSYKIKINDSDSITILDSSNNEISWIEYNDNNLSFFTSIDEVKTLQKNVSLSNVVSISFALNDEFNLLKCSLIFDEFQDCNFLINLGGMEIGN